MLPFTLLRKHHPALLVVLLLLGTLFPVLFQHSLNFLLEDLLRLLLAVFILVALFHHSHQITNSCWWTISPRWYDSTPFQRANSYWHTNPTWNTTTNWHTSPNWNTTFNGRTDPALWEKHTSVLGPLLELVDTTSSSIEWGAAVSSCVRNTP
jgi:hypothetical protein